MIEHEKDEKSSKTHEQNLTSSEKTNTYLKENIEERQKQVYLLRLRGYTNNQIANQLKVSPSTIEKDLQVIKSDVVKAFRNFRDKGVFEAFHDACGQIELIQNELWHLYEEEKSSANKVKILSKIQDVASSKLKFFEITPRTSNALSKLKEEEEREEFRRRFKALE